MVQGIWPNHSNWLCTYSDRPPNALFANYHPKLAAWAIIMTELELYLNGQAKNLNGQWGFGQVRMAIASFTKIRLNHIS